MASVPEETPPSATDRAPTFRVGLVQSRACPTPELALEGAIRGLEEAARRGAQVICLQELFLHPYFCQTHDPRHFELAEAVPGPTTQALSRVARRLEVVVVAPLFELRAPGQYHNSAAVIDADGEILGVYRKMHIPEDPQFHEKFYFTPGDLGFRVFSTRHARIGVLICWDQWFPEAARATALAGAEILFYPTAIGWLPGEKDELGERQRRSWRTVQVGHAIANQVPVAAVNRTGFESSGAGGIEFWGSSFVCDATGEVLAEASEGEEEVLVATCSRSDQLEQRRTWPFYRDRRVDAYGSLLSHLEAGT